MENIQEFKDMVAKLAKPGQDIINSLTPEKVDLLHMAVGVSGEAGELLDAVKKYTIYNNSLDRENIIEELGDLEFYLEKIRQNLNITREETIQDNINKLLKGKKARYSSGTYSDEQAQLRQDKDDEKSN